MTRSLAVRTLFLRALILAVGFSTANACPANGDVLAGGDCATAMSDAIQGVIDGFATRPIVLLGETHQRKEDHDFLRALVRDPRLPAVTRNLVVEFGNPRHQSVIDDYVNGKTVGRRQLTAVWREHAGTLLGWDSPLYQEFFDTVREVNRELPPKQRLRVLLADSPIDWQAVQRKEDFAPFANRDAFMAAVIEREILARGRTALVIVGSVHVPITAPSEEQEPHPGVADLLESRHPGSTYRIFTSRADFRSGAACHPAIISTAGPLGNRSFGELLEKGIQVQRVVNGKKQWVPLQLTEFPPMRAKVDAVLDLGEVSTRIEPLASTLEDRAYIHELHRRARIMSGFYGFDLEADLPPDLR